MCFVRNVCSYTIAQINRGSRFVRSRLRGVAACICKLIRTFIRRDSLYLLCHVYIYIYGTAPRSLIQNITARTYIRPYVEITGGNEPRETEGEKWDRNSRRNRGELSHVNHTAGLNFLNILRIMCSFIDESSLLSLISHRETKCLRIKRYTHSYLSDIFSYTKTGNIFQKIHTLS